jgi:KDO2-lipid IV(A) lauroyltransferase
MNKLSSLLLSLFAALPLSILYLISDILYYLLYYVLRYRLKVVSTNLQNAFPEKSTLERKKIAKKYYRYLADLIVETIKMKSISKKEIEKRMFLINPELIHSYFNKNQSIIFVTGHYGNWEWGIPRMSLMSNHPSLVIYKPLSNEEFEETFNKMRTRFGGTMVPMKSTLRKIIEHQDILHASVFLSDQTPTRNGSDYFINFLNQPTLAFKGIEKIAQKTNYPIVYCHINRIKRGYYQAKFTTLVEHPKDTVENEITHLHNKFLEEIIKEKPELWLWSHKRWKHKPKHD